MATEIDLTDWEFYCGDLNESVAKAATATLSYMLNEHPPRIYIPYIYSPKGDGRHGPAVTDPLLFYVELPLSSDEDDPVIYPMSLRDALQEVLGDEDIPRHKPGSRIPKNIAKALREEADKLDPPKGS